MDLRKIRYTAWSMVALAVFSMALTWLWRTANASVGTALPTPRMLDDLVLQTDDGGPWSFDTTLGRWTLAFFGFTTCPDICPTSMHYLRQELAELSEAERRQIQVLLISVDPERDVGRVGAYARGFAEDFAGVSGTPEQLKRAAAFFGVHYEKRVAAGSKLGYTIDHSGDFFLIDPYGRWVKVYRPPLILGRLARDLSGMIKRGSPLEVVDAWIRKPAADIHVTSAYMTLRSKHPHADQLIGVESTVAGSTEIHETAQVDGMMRMQQVTAVDVPAKGALELKPGGTHIMLMELRKTIQTVSQVPVVLRFSSAPPMKVMTPVRAQ